jgi:hypothetical protein
MTLARNSVEVLVFLKSGRCRGCGVQRAHDGAEFLRGQTDVDDDVVVVQLGPAKRGVHQERRPVQALRGPEDLATEAVGDHQVIADGDAEQRTTLQVRHV